MATAQFRLDTFEGPLDLLLALVAKHKMNIYDIEISLLLAQYLEYMEQLEYVDHEYEAEFLEMAARLVYIKTCSLLPHDEEGEELKKELEGRLIEYSLIKMAAAQLKATYAGSDVFVRSPMKLPVNKTYTREHEPDELLEAYLGISKKVRESEPVRAKLFEPIVSHRIVSVTSKIIYVLKKLYRTGECDMSGIYDGAENKSEKVATFLALLELTKSGRIRINDDNTKIYFNKESARRKKNEREDPDTVVRRLSEQAIEEVESVNDRFDTDSTEADAPDAAEQAPEQDPRIQSEFDVPVTSDAAPEEDIIPETAKAFENKTDKEQTAPGKREEKAMPARITPFVINIPAAVSQPEDEEPESTEAPKLPESSAVTEEEPVKAAPETAVEPAAEIEAVPEPVAEAVTGIEPEPEPAASIESEPEPVTAVDREQAYVPNFWSRLRYRWGYSPVGSQVRCGYWKFG